MRGFLRNFVEASVLTAGVAVCVLIALHEPRLLDCARFDLAALYLTAPFCWLMPLALRQAHLAFWLALILANWTAGPFTLWGEGLIGSAPAKWILAALFDTAFLFNGVLAIWARSKDWQALKSPHALSIIAAPTVGTTIGLLFWSTQISHQIADVIKSIKEPYCLAVNGRVIKSYDDASGLQLLRNTYFIGPGAGFSFPTFAQFHAIFAVQYGKTVRYSYWSFRKEQFIPVSAPMEYLGGYACDPLTQEAIVDDSHYSIGR